MQHYGTKLDQFVNDSYSSIWSLWHINGIHGQLPVIFAKCCWSSWFLFLNFSFSIVASWFWILLLLCALRLKRAIRDIFQKDDVKPTFTGRRQFSVIATKLHTSHFYLFISFEHNGWLFRHYFVTEEVTSYHVKCSERQLLLPVCNLIASISRTLASFGGMC